MNLCPSTHPDTGAPCRRWNQPAAHVMDDSHEDASGAKWPYPMQLTLDLAAVAATAQMEAR